MEITSEVRRRKLKLKQDLEAYSGDDPLKLSFDFLFWLDSTYGKDNCLVDFNDILVDSLNRFWQDSQYYNDERFIRILLYYCDLQEKPLEIFERSFKKGIGLGCSGFYSGWANKLCQVGMYNEADRIINLGFKNKASPEDALDDVYKQFLQTIGKKYFQGELNTVCPKCSGANVKDIKEEKAKEEPEDKSWEMNPLKLGEPDDFKTVIFYPEESDPSKKPMYPKEKVYRDNTEFCLEELKAASYLEKIMKAERNTIAQSSLSLKLSRDESRREQSHTHIGEYTKEAMDVIQQLWNSPEPMKENPSEIHKTPFPVYSENIVPMSIEAKKTTPFTVYMEDEPERNDLLPKGLTSLKKSQPAKSLFLSEKKPDAEPEKKKESDSKMFSDRKSEPKTSTSREQPPFQTNFMTSNLTEKFSQASIAKKSVPFADEDDTTCNTKAFAFLLPSSTPVHQKKSSTQQASKNDGSFIEESEKVEAKSGATENLSVIYEASKERFSSSSSSNGSSARTPGVMRVSLDKVENPIWSIYEYLFPVDNFSFTFFPLIIPEHFQQMIDIHKLIMSDWFLEEPPEVAQKEISEKKALKCIMQKSKSNDFEMRHLKSVNHLEERKSFQAPRSSFADFIHGFDMNSGRRILKTIQPFETMRPLNFETIVEDPFCPEQNENFLSQINFPLKHHLPFYAQSKSTMPHLTKNVKIDNKIYNVISEIGKGAYARVVRARCGDKDCALKVEKPACKWEFYIAKEIQRRVDPEMAAAFCDIERAFIFQNGSILQMNWAPFGTLLSLLSDHKIKTGRPLNRAISLYFGTQIVEIIDTLHKMKIIHGDVKPDNFVVTNLNFDPSKPNVQLIDFGRCIDMTFFPEGTQFTHVVNTDGFQCNEMKENKPWTYQTDLYGLAGSLYCLLAGNYMKVAQKDGVWKLSSILPRTLKRESWDLVFQRLLNVKPDSLPNLTEIKNFINNELGNNDFNSLSSHFRQLQNVLR